MGIQPRTAIGQTSDKTTLMLIIDGRQTHSLGTTVSECANILLRYGCWNAMNMDGGSSSSMTYMVDIYQTHGWFERRNNHLVLNVSRSDFTVYTFNVFFITARINFRN